MCPRTDASVSRTAIDWITEKERRFDWGLILTCLWNEIKVQDRQKPDKKVSLSLFLMREKEHCRMYLEGQNRLILYGVFRIQK